jgi:hypothetical protein
MSRSLSQVNNGAMVTSAQCILSVLEPSYCRSVAHDELRASPIGLVSGPLASTSTPEDYTPLTLSAADRRASARVSC